MPNSPGYTLWLCAAASLVALFVQLLGPHPFVSRREREYTYLNNDYPLEHSGIRPLDTVAMTLQESTHYNHNLTADPSSYQEWRTLDTHPASWGRSRLGPDQRVFVSVMYHEMHCLSRISYALLYRNTSMPETSAGHVEHCLNYLRQLLLCDAANMLEAGDWKERDWEVERVGDTLVCEDWLAVYDAMDSNYLAFQAWQSAQGF